MRGVLSPLASRRIARLRASLMLSACVTFHAADSRFHVPTLAQYPRVRRMLWQGPYAPRCILGADLDIGHRLHGDCFVTGVADYGRGGLWVAATNGHGAHFYKYDEQVAVYN